MPPFTYDPRLEPLLASIEACLITEVPKAVRALQVKKPCYALFLWYQGDSTCEDNTPQFGLGTHAVFDACAAQYNDFEDNDDVTRAGVITDCIWRPQQTLSDASSMRRFTLEAPGLTGDSNFAYRMMLEANTSPMPLPSEGEILFPFRAMMRRVAATLDATDWTTTLNPDASFAVVALDYIGEFFNDDINASLAPAKRAILEKRGLIRVARA